MRLLIWRVLVVILHWLQSILLIIDRGLVGHILALRAMADVLPLKWFVLPVHTVGAPATILVIERKNRLILDRLAALIGDILVIFRQDIVYLGIQVLLIKNTMTLRGLLKLKQLI